ncbi:MAG: hypothetical protein ISR59_06090 [Anaerolineales bacterium]|uniref:Uncharacterized protein n=1 Tax=Candidatus Desulfolinea nitratireducens TaxID=2841698 RepID=A0A8J6NHB3_9CHLR|nr:hypothetical protein [Candidatus Desulfolinea nitratireducens]MBL6960661.1 hypothetical protein [Anaerolineales bacterium]
MPKIIVARYGKTVLYSFLGGLLGALIGGSIGILSARNNDPTGWSEIPNLLSGLIYGYGLGVGAGAFMLHFRPHPPSAFSRAFLGALTGLFGVIFLSAPLHLDFFPPLMWGLLILLPPLISAGLLVSRYDEK